MPWIGIVCRALTDLVRIPRESIPSGEFGSSVGWNNCTKQSLKDWLKQLQRSFPGCTNVWPREMSRNPSVSSITLWHSSIVHDTAYRVAIRLKGDSWDPAMGR